MPESDDPIDDPSPRLDLSKLSRDELIQRISELAQVEANRRARDIAANRDAPDDIAQSVVREMLGDFDKIEFVDNALLGRFVRRVVRNKIIEKAKHIRAQKRDFRREQPLHSAVASEQTGLETDRPGPPTSVQLREELRRAQDSIGQLSDKPRRAIEMASRGASYAEIATALKVTTAYAHRLVSRAREILRKGLPPIS